MIGKQVALDVLVDEQTNFALFNDKYYIKLDGDAFNSFVDPAAVADVYIERCLRTPAEFVAVRQKIADKINALQALLS